VVTVVPVEITGPVTALVAELCIKYNTTVTISSSQAITDDMGNIEVDASAGSVTLTLPAPQGGSTFTIWKSDATANAVVITGPINGGMSYTISSQWNGVVLTERPGGWYGYHTGP
jgi:hypothetical protein